MTKQKFIFWIITLLMILLATILIATRWTAKAVNPNSERIAQLNFQLSELEYSKLNCLDNLTRKESKAQIDWFEKYCIEYDEQIMLINQQIDELSERKDEFEKNENIDYCQIPYERAFERLVNWYDTDVEHNIEVLEIQWCVKEANYIREQFQSNERTPWMLNESWDAQEMPKIEWNDEHEKFKKLSEAYWLDASQIRNVENHYWIKEWVILCITVAETSWWNRWAWWKNIWSVWSNDRWDRPTFALPEAWLEAIWKTLTNQYLWKIQTLWCLSNAWSCKSRDDRWYRYATSDWNRERNMKACLWTIYWNINASEFSIRR